MKNNSTKCPKIDRNKWLLEPVESPPLLTLPPSIVDTSKVNTSIVDTSIVKNIN